MALFDRSCTTFYWSAIVNIALSGTVFELFDVKWYHDLEIWVRGHSRSCKPVPFESFGAVSYSPSIVTMALSCIICEIKRDIGRKSWFFSYPLTFDAPVGRSTSEYCHSVWCGKTRMVGLTDSKNTRYLGVHFVKSRILKCSLDAAKRGFYRAANSIFGKIGWISSEEVVL